MTGPQKLFATVVAEYQRVEPDGADTWNPLHRDRELFYRLALYEHLCLALRRCPAVADLRVLDVGCGNGRSTRMYLDFGLSPGQLTGIDLRPAAIATACHSHGGIRFLVYDGGGFPIESATVDWVSLCTVMSSIGDREGRRHIAREIARVLAPGGLLFYFDRLFAAGFAAGFAGADLLVVDELFRELTRQSEKKICYTSRMELLLSFWPIHRLALPLFRKLGYPRTMRACLFQKE